MVLLVAMMLMGLYIAGHYKVLAALVTFVLLVAVLKKAITTL